MSLVWAILAVLLVILSVTLVGYVRLAVLKAVLVLTAIGEALAFVSNSFRPRRFAEQNRRPFHPALHGVTQDFGFYNLQGEGEFRRC
jgi:purine-cytosine permease-like protein